MTNATIHYAGSDFELYAHDVPSECYDDLLSLGGMGDQTYNVKAFLERWNVTGDAETVRKYLEGYGAWEPEELADHTANLERMVWLTGCAMAEDGQAYFAAY